MIVKKICFRFFSRKVFVGFIHVEGISHRWFIEFVFTRNSSICRNGLEISTSSWVKFFFMEFSIERVSFSRLGAFYFAHAVNSFLTNIGKLFIGAFRPHFIPSCFKKFNYHDFCNDTTQWIVNYTCLGENSSNEKIQYGAFNIR